MLSAPKLIKCTPTPGMVSSRFVYVRISYNLCFMHFSSFLSCWRGVGGVRDGEEEKEREKGRAGEGRRQRDKIEE